MSQHGKGAASRDKSLLLSERVSRESALFFHVKTLKKFFGQQQIIEVCILRRFCRRELVSLLPLELFSAP
jgi:hypothetical protein